MISAEDIYKVISAVVPLYVAMILAYGSVRWWKLLTPEQCGGINRFVAIFAVPFLSFHYIASNDPYKMNLKFIAADSLQKIAILMALTLWTRYSRNGSLEWMITLFMLATLPNTLVMGIPLLAAMYGNESGSLVVQAVVLQCIIWYTLLLFLYEFRSAKILISEQFPETAASIVSFKVDSDVISLDGREPLQTKSEIKDDGKIHVTVTRRSTSSQSHCLLSPKRSLSSSTKEITPRPSNLTGTEIYSVQSSRNITPRESSFIYIDPIPTNNLRQMFGSPRQSNFTASDVYSLHSSRAPTPRASNFTEDNFKDLHVYDNKLVFPLCSYYSTSAAGVRLHGGGDGLMSSPKHYHHHSESNYQKSTDIRAPAKTEADSKDLHMFTWNSGASPVPDGVQAFGAGGGVSVKESEVKVAVESSNQQDTAIINEKKINANEHNFSFGNQKNFGKDEYYPADKEGSSLTKLTSSSTAELAPKTPKTDMPPATVMFKLIFSLVWRKLVQNPNTYSSLLGITWALISYRCHAKLPLILENSIAIISNAGLGMAMFSLGLFMALQKKLLACGTSLSLFGMAVRFLSGPAVMAAASIGVGMRGVTLRVSIVQAALPQGIVPFVFAKEYNVHPDVLSTAVIFGMLVALPINMVYYILLGL